MRDQDPWGLLLQLLLPDSQKQAITHVTQPRFQHALGRQLSIHTGDPDFDALGPFGRGLLHTWSCTQYGQDKDALGTPLTERLNGGGAGASGGDDGVEDDGESGRGGRVGGRYVVGEVVVVFDRFEGGGFTVETEVVDGDGIGKDGLDCFSFLGYIVSLLLSYYSFRSFCHVGNRVTQNEVSSNVYLLSCLIRTAG